MNIRYLIAATLACHALSAQAGQYDPLMRSYLENEVAKWAQDPVILDALRTQNLRTEGFMQTEITALDADWAAQVDKADAPLVQEVTTGPTADFLRMQLQASGGIISEIILMDHLGLNAAASQPTSDYWQGDEAKFSETYPKGPGAMHFGEVEFDESAKGYVGQASFSIVDPATQQVIGAMTIGLNAEMLF